MPTGSGVCAIPVLVSMGGAYRFRDVCYPCVGKYGRCLQVQGCYPCVGKCDLEDLGTVSSITI